MDSTSWGRRCLCCEAPRTLRVTWNLFVRRSWSTQSNASCNARTCHLRAISDAPSLPRGNPGFQRCCASSQHENVPAPRYQKNIPELLTLILVQLSHNVLRLSVELQPCAVPKRRRGHSSPMLARRNHILDIEHPFFSLNFPNDETAGVF